MNKEQQKQDFRIFNLAVMNRTDCQSAETGRKEISWEVIPLLQAESNESLNYDNVSRTMSDGVRGGH